MRKLLSISLIILIASCSNNKSKLTQTEDHYTKIVVKTNSIGVIEKELIQCYDDGIMLTTFSNGFVNGQIFLDTNRGEGLSK